MSRALRASRSRWKPFGLVLLAIATLAILCVGGWLLFAPLTKPLDFLDTGSYIRSLAVSANGSVLATGHANGDVSIWSCASRSSLGRLAVHEDIGSLAVSAEGDLIAASGEDGGVKIVSVETHACLWTIPGGVGTSALLFARDGERLFVAKTSGSLEVWAMRSGKLLSESKGHDGVVWRMTLDNMDETLATSGADNVVRMWSTSDLRPCATWPMEATVKGLAFTKDGSYLLSGDALGMIRVWDMKAERETYAWHGHDGAILGLAVDDDNEVIASIGLDRMARLWQIQSWRLRDRCRADQYGSPQFIAFCGMGSAKSWLISYPPGSVKMLPFH
jgi:WD40 repeat protein